MFGGFFSVKVVLLHPKHRTETGAPWIPDTRGKALLQCLGAWAREVSWMDTVISDLSMLFDRRFTVIYLASREIKNVSFLGDTRALNFVVL